MTEYSSLKASCTRMHADFITKSRTIPLEFATPCLQSPIDSVVWTGLLIKTLYNYHFTVVVQCRWQQVRHPILRPMGRGSKTSRLRGKGPLTFWPRDRGSITSRPRG